MHIKRIKEIIKNYLDGTTSAIEKKALDSWLSSVEKLPIPHTPTDLHDIKNAIWAGIENQHITNGARPMTKRIILWPALGAAVALIVIGFFAVRDIDSGTHTFATGKGESKTVELVDGSVVTLQENTQLIVADDFEKSADRKVRLVEGEAFFQVHRNPERPFRVAGSGMQTEVLGTSFIIRTSKEDAAWSIWVKSGKVRVSKPTNASETYTLGANDSLTYALDKDRIGWVDQESDDSMMLSFKDNNLEQIAEIIAERYGVVLTIEKGLERTHKFSGEFHSDQPLEEILDMICLATGTQQIKNGNTIMLKSSIP